VSRRIALVFFGQPRFVDNGLAFQSHKWLLRKYLYDVYGHYWYSRNAEYQRSSWTRLKTKFLVPDNAPQVIRRSFPEGTFIESQPRIFSPTKSFAHLLTNHLTDTGLRTEFERLGSTPESMYSNTMSQLFSINQALGLLRTSMKQYDLIVLSRWDNAVLRLPNLETLIANKLTVSDAHDFGFPDLLFIGSPQLIDAVDAYSAIPGIFETVPSMTAEKIKQAHFLQSYSLADVQRKVIKVSIVRGSALNWFALEIIYRPALNTIARFIPSFVRRHLMNRPLPRCELK